mmetsp:Transcript_13791/g.17966  ORF Transcript_13791/g.17966 Transcript_13791/m.17966 type:complete len:422 (+) Transcript_13791:370-1635(+)
MEFILGLISKRASNDGIGRDVCSESSSSEASVSSSVADDESNRVKTGSLDIDSAKDQESQLMRGILSLSDFDDAAKTRTSNMRKDHFSRLKVLGIGSFGKVTLVREKSSQKMFAMKQIKKVGLTDRMKTRMRMERNVMALHRHESIVKLHYAFQDEDKVYMVMDYCAGGDLYYHLHPSRRGKNKSGLAKFVISQVLQAIGHLHSHRIIYRDLKPENVLFDSEGYVKLADFGLSKAGIFSATSGATSVCGSLHYLAPEVLLLSERPEGSQYGFAADYWGLGILLYEMLFGLPPWFASDREAMCNKLRNKPLHLSSKLPENISDFISKLLTKDPSNRLGSKGLEDVQSHCYFKDVSWEKLRKRQYSPCFIPSAEEDACNFDESYTRLPVQSSICVDSVSDKFKNRIGTASSSDSSIIDDFDFQ